LHNDIRCYSINHKFEKGVKLSLKYIPSFNISLQLNPLSSFCLVLKMQPHYGKEFSLHGLWIKGLIITRIQDVSPTPHNGCQLSISLKKAIIYLGYLQRFTKVVAYYARKHENSKNQFLIKIWNCYHFKDKT